MNKGTIRYPVTYSLLVVTIAVFILMVLSHPSSFASSRTVYDFGGLFGKALIADPSQIWRLISPVFVHIGFQHILFNAIALYYVGSQLEGILGPWKFLMLYFLSGLMGNLATFFFSPEVVSAGASTSIFGLFAFAATLRFFTRSPYLQYLSNSYISLLIINIVVTFTAPGISVTGHLGGAIGGVLCAMMIPIRGEERAFTQRERVLAIGVYLLLLIIGLSPLLSGR
ncbi:rhomboid family intramembrane serine protease [Streptococcus sp. DD13]|uniref:rhomboid family intramembrane serine protease n=1 Tax=Streptococcus sp. DD13 TaxID=1777881 RepID=UPI00079161CB|nr:rhomboid family intramembrane serine protease [Streptococcus sp. DD13]KXT77671.1 GlpG protein (membrane protein of glp regulon) [Streptococcus sp. DD13]